MRPARPILRSLGLAFASALMLVGAALALRTLPSRATAGVEAPTNAGDSSGAIAVCDLVGVVEKLMDSDRFKPARDEATASSEQAIAEFRTRLQAAEEAARAATPDSPNLEDIRREFQAAQMAFQRKGQELAQEMDRLATKQLGEAFEIARASAEAVAQARTFAYVLSSRAADKPLDAPDTASVVRAMLARPVILFPKAADITDDVLQDLKLD